MIENSAWFIVNWLVRLGIVEVYIERPSVELQQSPTSVTITQYSEEERNILIVSKIDDENKEAESRIM